MCFLRELRRFIFWINFSKAFKRQYQPFCNNYIQQTYLMSWEQQGQQNQQGWGQPNPNQPGQQNVWPGQEVIAEKGWEQPQAQQNQFGWGQPGQQNQPGFQQQGWGGQQVQQGQQYPQVFNPNPNQVYKVVLAANPNLSLDCSGQFFDLKQLIIYGYHNGNNQKWRFVSDGTGAFSIVCLEGGGAIELEQTSNKKGGRLWVSPKQTNAPNQKWIIQQVQKGYSIKSAVNRHGLNVEGNNLEDSTNVILWPFNNAINQVWSIQPI